MMLEKVPFVCVCWHYAWNVGLLRFLTQFYKCLLPHLLLCTASQLKKTKTLLPSLQENTKTQVGMECEYLFFEVKLF